MLAPRQDVKLAGGNNGAKSVARVVSFSSSSPSRCDCVQERPYQRVAVGRINGDSQSSAPWADPTVSSDENIFLERSSSGSTRNAAATRPQPTLARAPTSTRPQMVRRWLDPAPLHTIDKAPKDGPSQHGSFLQIVWGISTSNTGRVPVSSIINALCTALNVGGRIDFQLHVCFPFPHVVLMSVAARCLFFCCLSSTSRRPNVARSFMHTRSSPTSTR
jgi:hypothetical protein